MVGESLAAFFLVYARPVAAIGRILDRGRLLYALGLALAVSVLVHVPEMRTVPVQMPGVAAPAAAADDEAEAPAVARPSGFELAVNTWIGIEPSTYLAGLGAIILGFVPAIIGIRAITGWGSFGVLMRRDYMSMLMAVTMVWAAAYLPVGVIL